MRGIMLPALPLGALLWGVVAAGACEPVPSGGGRFWPQMDAGLTPVTPQPDAAEPPDPGTGGTTGTGGSTETGGTTGSGGATETGGTTGSGGVTETGGTTGTGGGMQTGGGTGSGGGRGTGGAIGSGGALGSGGRIASGGTTGSGGRIATGGVTGTGGATGVLTGTLKVSVTTKAAGGKYQPRNVGAIWIADSGTKFVKSLHVWAAQRRSYLSHWVSATSAAGVANNVVDAVTAATMSSHGVRTATWNGTNVSKALVPDGAYKVCFELSDGTTVYQCVDFNKSRNAQSLTPADNSSFTMRSIGYTP